MRVTLISIVSGLAGLSVAQVPADITIKNIQTITTKASSLIPIVDGLNIVTILTSWGPIQAGLSDIISTISADTILGGSQPKTFHTIADSVEISDAYTEFARVSEALVNTVLKKHDVIAPFHGAPLAATLRGLEAVVDTFAFEIIGSVDRPAQAKIQDNQKSIDSAFQKIIAEF